MNRSTVRNLIRSAAVASLVLAAGAGVVHAQMADSMMPDELQAQVETLDGQNTTLAALVDGKPLVLEFWATWCPLCKELEPAMEAAKEKYAGRVTFIGVGVPQNQSPERQQAYVTKAELKGHFVFDRNQEALKAFQVPHTSYLVVMDAEGTVVYTGQGGDQDVDAAIARALKP